MLRLLLSTLSLLFLLPNSQAANIVETAQAEADLSTLVTAVVAANLTETLSNTSPLTVFAPDNNAFAALPAEVLTGLLYPVNVAKLTQVLTYHVVAGNTTSDQLTNGQMITTLEGSQLTINIGGDPATVMVNTATVIAADVICDNGVVHIINEVLIPTGFTFLNIVETAQAETSLSTLVEAVVAANLTDTLSNTQPLTVFAPTNAAFSAVDPLVLAYLLNSRNQEDLVSVLSYHVVGALVTSDQLSDGQMITTLEGSQLTINIGGDPATVMVNTATVTTADIGCINGVVHIIDQVLIPSDLSLPPTLVALAQANTDLSTLVTALVTANLTGTLNEVGPYTVFAPNNAAFAAVPAADLTALLADVTALTSVLTYHVASGLVYSSDLSDGQMIPTLNSNTVLITISSSVMVNNATVVTPDVSALNGVVHIIDSVLLPPNFVFPDGSNSGSDSDSPAASIVPLFGLSLLLAMLW